MYMCKCTCIHCLHVRVGIGTCSCTMYILYINMSIYMINIHTLEKYKAKTYKSNPKATTFQRKIAALGGT